VDISTWLMTDDLETPDCSGEAWLVYNETNETWYPTIQGAIDAAGDDNIIKVYPGTFNEAIVINKPNLTIQSTEGRDVTIIDVPFGTLTTGVGVVSNMGTVTFNGFTVKNFTESGIIQKRSDAEGTTFHVLNNYVKAYPGYLRNGIQVSGDGSSVIGNYVLGQPLTQSWSSTAIHVVNAQNILVENNEVNGIADVGIGVTNWDADLVSDITVRSNEVDGAGESIRISGQTGDREVTNVTIENNILKNSPSFAGIDIFTVTATNITITENEITDNVYFGITAYPPATINGLTVNKNTIADNSFAGVYFYEDVILDGTIEIKENAIFGNTTMNLGNASTSAVTVDATCNWWGTDDYNLISNSVFNAVFIEYLIPDANGQTYPWSDGATYSCTGEEWFIYNTTLETFHPTIQDAIDLAEIGNTIEVPEGEYPEDITINVAGLTLNGAGRDLTKIIGQGTNETEAVRIAANGVTIDGFEIQGNKKPVRIPVPTTGVSFVNNRIVTGDNATSQNAWVGFEVYWDQEQTDLVIDNNIFVANKTAQLVYLNKASNLKFTNNAIEGEMRAGGLTVGLGGLNGSHDISNNNFDIFSSYALLEVDGNFDVFELLNVNTWPQGGVAGGNKIHNMIQPAINDVVAGSEIRVAAGTYEENLSIDKSLTINGPNAAIDPNNGSRVEEAVLMPPATNSDAILAAATDITVIIKGLKVDMTNALTNSQVFYAASKNGNWTFENNIFENYGGTSYAYWWITGTYTTFNFTLNQNLFQNNGVSNGIMFDSNPNSPNVTITNNVWNNNEGWALNTNKLNGTISDNSFIDTRADGLQWYQYQSGFILARDGVDVNVSSNSFDGVYNGISFYGGSAAFSGTAAVSQNEFLNIRNAAINVSSTASSISGVTISSNSFIDNGLSINNALIGSILMATHNYWNGCPSFSGEVEIYPYYTTVAGTAGNLVFGGQIDNIVAKADGSTGTINICEGQSVLLTAEGGANYSWDNGLGGGSSKIVTPDDDITYTVTGEDANGCALAYASVTVNVTAAPTVTISGPTVAQINETVTLEASGAAIYQWIGATPVSGEPHKANVTLKGPGSVTVGVMGSPATGNCAGRATHTITAAYVDAGNNIWSCAGEDVTLSAVAYGFTPTTYTWTPGPINGAEVQVSPETTTTYEVTATDGDVTVTDQVTVFVYPKPIANAGPAQILAGGQATLQGSASGGTAPYSYAWTTSDGNIVSGANTATPLVDQAGTYTLIVTDAFGCVSDEDQVEVTGTTAGTFTVSGNVSYAYGVVNEQMHEVEVKLVGTGSEGTFTGYTAATGPGNYSIPNVLSGTYNVFLYSPKPWGGVTSADIVAINNHVRNRPGWELTGIKRLAADVETNSTAANINNADRLLVNQRRLNPGNSSLFAATGDWVFTKAGDMEQTGPTYNYSHAGDTPVSNIEITVADADVEQDFVSLVYGDVNASYTGLKILEIEGPMVYDGTDGDWLELMNYPNPFAGNTTIRFYQPVEGNATLEIFDFTGNKVKTIQHTSGTEGEHELSFSAHGMAPGVYMVTLTLHTSDDILKQTAKMIITR